MKLLTDNRIDFKVIISSSDIALSEYELFYELQSKKCRPYHNEIANVRYREENSMVGYKYNLDKKFRKVNTRRLSDDEENGR